MEILDAGNRLFVAWQKPKELLPIDPLT